MDVLFQWTELHNLWAILTLVFYPLRFLFPNNNIPNAKYFKVFCNKDPTSEHFVTILQLSIYQTLMMVVFSTGILKHFCWIFDMAIVVFYQASKVFISIYHSREKRLWRGSKWFLCFDSTGIISVTWLCSAVLFCPPHGFISHWTQNTGNWSTIPAWHCWIAQIVYFVNVPWLCASGLRSRMVYSLVG